MTRFRLSAVAVTVAALLLCFTPARAAGDTLQLAVANVGVDAEPEADDIDGQGTAYAVDYDLPVSTFGAFALHFGLSRVDGVGSAGLGGWAFALGGQLNVGDVSDNDGDPLGVFSGYFRGDVGVTWADAREVTTEVPVVTVPPSLHGTQPVPAPAATLAEIEIDTEVSEQFVTAAAVAGVRLVFDRASGLGIGAEVAYRAPLNDGVSVENATAVRLYFSVPTTQ